MASRSAICTWRKGQDPLWEGEALQDILKNDSIYSPVIFEDLLEYAWKSWRSGELNDDGIRSELQVLVDWLNQITETRPKTEFWQKYF